MSKDYQLKGSIVGREVYDKTKGLMGTVTQEDGFGLVISYYEGNELKKRHVSLNLFSSEYQLLEDNRDSKKPEITRERKRIYREPQNGKKGIGMELARLFLERIKAIANQDVDFTEKSDYFSIKYNGHSVFECYIRDRRFIVFCRDESLSAFNRRFMARLYPKKMQWSLRAEYIFTEKTQKPLMYAIISDGLYYRQILERIKEDDE